MECAVNEHESSSNNNHLTAGKNDGKCVRTPYKQHHGGVHYLQRREVVVDEKREATHRDDQELHPESVMVAVIRGFELGVDQVHCGVRTSDIDNLQPKKNK